MRNEVVKRKGKKVNFNIYCEAAWIKRTAESNWTTYLRCFLRKNCFLFISSLVYFNG